MCGSGWIGSGWIDKYLGARGVFTLQLLGLCVASNQLRALEVAGVSKTHESTITCMTGGIPVRQYSAGWEKAPAFMLMHALWMPCKFQFHSLYFQIFKYRNFQSRCFGGR